MIDCFIKLYIDTNELNNDSASVCSEKSSRSIYLSPIYYDVHREVNIIKHLFHDNIIFYYGEISRPGMYGYVMEYSSEGNLQERIFRKGCLSEAEIKVFLIQMLGALKYLASNHIVHRDIKTRNILLFNGVYKLCDFGSSVLLDVSLDVLLLIICRNQRVIQ